MLAYSLWTLGIGNFILLWGLSLAWSQLWSKPSESPTETLLTEHSNLPKTPSLCRWNSYCGTQYRACTKKHTYTNKQTLPVFFLHLFFSNLFHWRLQGFNLNLSAWMPDVINGDDFTCHTAAAKDPVDHIVPLQIVYSILLYGLRQRMYEIIKPDGRKCCAWMMVTFSESGPLWRTVFPNRHINQRSFPRSHLEMNTVQSFLRTSILPVHEVSQPMNTKGKIHSTLSGCLSSNYHRRLSTEEQIFHQHSNMMRFPVFLFAPPPRPVCAQMFISVHVGSNRLRWEGKEARAAAHDDTIQ